MTVGVGECSVFVFVFIGSYTWGRYVSIRQHNPIHWAVLPIDRSPALFLVACLFDVPAVLGSQPYLCVLNTPKYDFSILLYLY